MKMPSETCLDVLSSLPLFVGGDLEQEALRAVDTHLALCAACRAACERARGSRSALGVLRSAGDAPDLWPGLRRALVADGTLHGLAQRANASGREAASRAPLVLAPPPAPSLLRRLAPFATLAAAALVALTVLVPRSTAPAVDQDGLNSTGSGGPPVAQELSEEREGDAALAESAVFGDPLAGGLRRVGADEPSLIEELGAGPVVVPVFVAPGLRQPGLSFDRAAGLQPAGNFR